MRLTVAETSPQADDCTLPIETMTKPRQGLGMNSVTGNRKMIMVSSATARKPQRRHSTYIATH